MCGMRKVTGTWTAVGSSRLFSWWGENSPHLWRNLRLLSLGVSLAGFLPEISLAFGVWPFVVLVGPVDSFGQHPVHFGDCRPQMWSLPLACLIFWLFLVLLGAVTEEKEELEVPFPDWWGSNWYSSQRAWVLAQATHPPPLQSKVGLPPGLQELTPYPGRGDALLGPSGLGRCPSSA